LAIARRADMSHWIALLVSRILSIALGVVAFLLPGVTAIALLYLIAVWAIVTGISEIVAGIRLRKLITGEWLLILAGVLSVALGIILILLEVGLACGPVKRTIGFDQRQIG
jgi:uncharacterized membrane protein HdeD (DUF308 family)